MRGEGKKLAQLVRLWASNQLQTEADDDAAAHEVDESAAAWGLQCTSDDAQSAAEPETVFYIWPKSLGTWQLWQRLQSMWRTGLAGRDGLDWPSVVAWLQHAEGMGPKKLADALQCLRVMEVAALNVWAQQAEKSKRV